MEQKVKSQGALIRKRRIRVMAVDELRIARIIIIISGIISVSRQNLLIAYYVYGKCGTCF